MSVIKIDRARKTKNKRTRMAVLKYRCSLGYRPYGNILAVRSCGIANLLHLWQLGFTLRQLFLSYCLDESQVIRFSLFISWSATNHILCTAFKLHVGQSTLTSIHVNLGKCECQQSDPVCKTRAQSVESQP